MLHRLLASFTLSAAISLALVPSAPASAPPPGSAHAVAPGTPDCVPGELLLQIAAESFASGAFRADLARGGRTGLAALDARLADLGVTEMAPVFDLSPYTGEKQESGLDRIFVARYAGNMPPQDAVRSLAGSPDVAFAEPNWIAHAMLTPNDPTYPSQWAHNNTGQAISYGGGLVGTPDCDTDTPEAWDLQTGSSAIIVAIVDTGVDTGHPEFSGRVVAGYDFVNNDSDPTDDNGHGTCCAGITLGAGNNAQGIAGVAWGVRLMAVKVLNASGSGSYTAVANGINFAADNGAKILSLSLGGPASATLQTAVDYAVNTRGCAMFAATGNANASSLDYPAAYSNVISVGALSPCNERKNPSSCDGEYWWGSNYGTGIDFLAPGTRIHTTDIRGAGGFGSGDYIPDFNGTSSATPHAVGIGALVWSQNAALTNTGLLTVLQNNCDDLGAAGYDTQTGYGRMNAQRAVQNAGGGGCSPTPGANFSGAPTSGVAPLAVNFTDLSTGSPASWSWNFGDGGTSAAQNPSHTYASAGTYNVTLTITNACGSDDEVKNGYITATGGGGPVTLFSEGYEISTVPGSLWSAGDSNPTNGSDYWGDQSSGSGARVHSGSWSAYCADNASPVGQRYDNYMNSHMTKITGITVSGYTNVTFSFWKWHATYNSNDYLSFQYWNGSAWTEAQRWSGASSVWQQLSYTLTGFTTFQFRFVFVSNSVNTAEGAYIDDILLTGVPARTGGEEANQPMRIALVGEVSEGTPAFAAGRPDLPDDAEGIAALVGPARILAAPNPFRPETVLRFALAQEADVALAIYSADGRRIAMLMHGVQAAGEHAVTWRGADESGAPVAPGVYFARLEVAGRQTSVERLVMLK